jgi:hypothetical protein
MTPPPPRSAPPLAPAGVASPMIGGARSHFTEYNREHARIPRDVDGVVIATTPLFHSLGTEQLVESLAVQRLIARADRSRWRAARPCTSGRSHSDPRFNNVATAPEPHPTRDDLAEGYGAQFTGAADRRQTAPGARRVDCRERCGPRDPGGGEPGVVRGVGTPRHPLC